MLGSQRMRLICPNCGAQYEVDDSMVPPDGRDVQCSNCATTWFQAGARRRAAEVDDSIEAASPAVTPRRKPRKPAQETLDVLRQEAAHEARMREAETLETQEELGLQDPDDPIERGKEARARIAELRRPDPEEASEDGPDAKPDDPEPDVAVASEEAVEPTVPIAPPEAPPEGRPGGSRRDLLPDIEEINSTLRPDEMGDQPVEIDLAPEEAAALVRRKKGGRRIGFGLVLMVAAVALMVYISVPRLSAQFPQFAEPLTAYADWVNDLRMTLNASVEGLVERLRAFAQV